jgi:hypothetical protein
VHGVGDESLYSTPGAVAGIALGRVIAAPGHPRDDTTYLRHEMLHHILEVGGWHPKSLDPGERYTIADLHPMPFFDVCSGGGDVARVGGSRQ